MSEDQLHAMYQNLNSTCVNETILLSVSKVVSLTNQNNQDLKPDVLICDQNSQRNAVSVIELKAPNLGTQVPAETSDEVKQLCEYLAAILGRQPYRTFAYGALTNHRYLTMVRAAREATAIKYTIIYNGFFEGSWIQWLRESSLSVLGMVYPTVRFGKTPYTLQDYLGSGQFCHAYKVVVGGDTIVVKGYPDKRYAAKEKEICQKLKGCPYAMQLYAKQPIGDEFVAVNPYAQPFSSERRINSVHVRQLMDALSALHRIGMVHGDVCAQNIYYVDASTALLNDWSHVESSDDDEKRLKDFHDLYGAAAEVGAGMRNLAPLLRLIADGASALHVEDEPVSKKPRTRK